MNQSLLVFLTFSPTYDQLHEYSQYGDSGYDVYVIIDDNDFSPPLEFSRICIQIKDSECIGRGFLGFNPAIVKRSRCSAWDKAVYVLTYILCDYQRCWIVEEDVFIPSPSILLQLDIDYPLADLLVESCSMIDSGYQFASNQSWPWTRHMPGLVFLPKRAHGMVCACRMSRQLIYYVGLFIKRYSLCFSCFNMFVRGVNVLLKKLPGMERCRLYEKYPFIEYIFHSIALSRGLSICVPGELGTIQWRGNVDIHRMVTTNLYHPVKDVSSHARIRKLIFDDSL